MPRNFKDLNLNYTIGKKIEYPSKYNPIKLVRKEMIYHAKTEGVMENWSNNLNFAHATVMEGCNLFSRQSLLTTRKGSQDI